MAFVDEIEKTKLIVKKYDDEAQKYWDLMAKASKAAEKEFDKNKNSKRVEQYYIAEDNNEYLVATTKT